MREGKPKDREKEYKQKGQMKDEERSENKITLLSFL